MAYNELEPRVGMNGLGTPATDNPLQQSVDFHRLLHMGYFTGYSQHWLHDNGWHDPTTVQFSGFSRFGQFT